MASPAKRKENDNNHENHHQQNLKGNRLLLTVLTGEVGGDEEEGRAEEGEAHPHRPLGLDLREDPGGDGGVLHLCVDQTHRGLESAQCLTLTPNPNPVSSELTLGVRVRVRARH